MPPQNIEGELLDLSKARTFKLSTHYCRSAPQLHTSPLLEPPKPLGYLRSPWRGKFEAQLKAAPRGPVEEFGMISCRNDNYIAG